ncbi:X antigen family member 1-like [Pongo abelii]|uniref:X antigen family member 1-like n=1 Tax=Pongo abelii TaxID=9601 RepID=UPI0023E7C937|nr:X antigen family member 1-like [Pongo abelii]
MRHHGHGPSGLGRATTREEGGPRSGGGSPVMKSLKKRNHQLKVGILHLVRKEKKNRVQLRFKCLTWKLISRSCLSQRLGMHAEMILMSRGRFCQN